MYVLSLKAQNELAFFNNGLLFEIFFFQQLICYLFVRLCFQFYIYLQKMLPAINNTTHHEY